MQRCAPNRRSALSRPAPTMPAAMLALVVGLIATACDAAEDPAESGAVFQSEAATFRVVQVVDGLRHPWAVAFLPDGRLLTTERDGRMRIHDGERRTEVRGLPEITARGQGGLMDVVLHPDFADNRRIYFSYAASYDGGVGTRVARAVLDGDRLVDLEVLFQMDPPGSGGRHFGCRLAFDEEGYLFFTIGERGDRHRAQQLDSHHGTVIRLHEDGSVPDDNPFVDEPGAHPEIYSYGHRNAQGLVYDPKHDRLWLHEHGPFGGDELQFVLPGENYGWPVATYGVEYRDRSEIGTTPDKHPDVVEPVVYWAEPHSIAPSGLALYRGDKFPEWDGDLFLGALARQHIRRVVLDDDGKTVIGQEKLLEGEYGRIRDVRTGPDGNLWFVNDVGRGGVYRIEPVE